MLKANEHLSKVEPKAQGELAAELVVAWNLCGDADQARRVAQGLTQEQRDEAYQRLGLALAYRHDVDGAIKAAKSITAPKQRYVVYGQVAMSHTMRGDDGAASDTLRLIENPMILEEMQRRVIGLQTARPGADSMGIISKMELSPHQRDEMAGLVAAKLAERGDETAVAMAVTIANAFVRAETYAQMAEWYNSAGRKDLAKRAIEGALESGEREHDALRKADMLMTTAKAMVACGQAAEAVALLDKADRLIAQMSESEDQYSKIAVEFGNKFSAVVRVAAYMQMGNLAEAKRVAGNSDGAIGLLADELARREKWDDLSAWMDSLEREDQRVRAWISAAEQLCKPK